MVKCPYTIMADNIVSIFCLVALNDFALIGFCVTPGRLSFCKAMNSVTYDWAFEIYSFNLLLPKMSQLSLLYT